MSNKKREDTVGERDLRAAVFNKVIAVYSKTSRSRDWPSFERQIAEQVEAIVKTPVLIYLRLDRTPLKAHDPNRISIGADGKTLKEVGAQILRALGIDVERPRHEYDENEPL